MTETTTADSGYIEIPVRLPNELWAKIDPLAKAAGLTIEQMTQAIFVLQMNAGGWLKQAESKSEPEEKE